MGFSPPNARTVFGWKGLGNGDAQLFVLERCGHCPDGLVEDLLKPVLKLLPFHVDALAGT